MEMKAFEKLSYGLYIISSIQEEGGKCNGQIANAVIQIVNDPPTIAISINKKNMTHDCIAKSGVFSLSVLTQETPMTFIGKFGFKSGRNINKFEGVNFKTGKSGVPLVLDYTSAVFEAKVINQVDCGPYSIFIASVVDTRIVGDGIPMTYAYYHMVKRGKSPKTAPTHIKT